MDEGYKEQRNVYEEKWVGLTREDNSAAQQRAKYGRAAEKTMVLEPCVNVCSWRFIATYLPAQECSTTLGTSRYASSAVAGRRGRLISVFQPTLLDQGSDIFAPPKSRSKKKGRQS